MKLCVIHVCQANHELLSLQFDDEVDLSLQFDDEVMQLHQVLNMVDLGLMYVITKNRTVFEKFISEYPLSRIQAKVALEILKWSLHSTCDDLTDYIIGYGYYADPVIMMDRCYDFLANIHVLQRRSRFLGICSPSAPCYAPRCPMRKAVQCLQKAQANLIEFTSQLSDYGSEEDILEKTYDSQCSVCLSKDFKFDKDFVFITNCRHMFCRKCFDKCRANKKSDEFL